MMALPLASTFDTALALLGRAHPMVLHLPIGLIGALVVMEAWRVWRGEREMPSVALPIAWLNAATATAAVVSGLLLATEPGYGGSTLDRHRLLGIALGILCVLAAIGVTLASRRRTSGATLAFRSSLAGAALLLVPAGHLGATMTHGEDFLTAPLRASAETRTAVTVANDGLPQSVRGILESKCTACHGGTRTKGLLDLRTRRSIEAGGETGAVVAWGAPDESPMLTRMLLAQDHDDHMPPDGKPQPTAAEIEAIRAWIAGGGEAPGGADPDWGTVLAESQPSASESTGAANAATAPKGPTADPKALAALRAKLVHVQPISSDSPYLWIDFAATPGVDDAGVRELLDPLRAMIGDLSLARSGVTDAITPLLATMPHLRRLDLRSTAITDEGLTPLATCVELEELVLVGTKVTERSLTTIKALPKLTALYLWNTAIPRDPIVALRAERPAMLIEADEAVAAALEVEPALTFSSDAPPPGATAATPPNASAAAIAPINDVCPVSGAAVNPARVIVWEGRAIGFCCEKCAAQFWAEPAKFVGNVKAKAKAEAETKAN